MKTETLSLNGKFILKVKDTNYQIELTHFDFDIKMHDKFADYDMSYQFIVSDNIDMNYVKHILKADKMFDAETGCQMRKKDYVTDCELYEIIDNQVTKVMDLFNVVLCEYNEINKSVNIYCDYQLYNPESQTIQQLSKFKNQKKNEYNDKLEQYHQLCNDLDINPNESVFSNNFRKSMNKFDWFKPYKI